MWADKLMLLDDCVIKAPNKIRPRHNFATDLHLAGRTQEAIDCLKMAFMLDPSIRSEFAKEYPEIKSSKLFKKLLGEI